MSRSSSNTYAQDELAAGPVSYSSTCYRHSKYAHDWMQLGRWTRLIAQIPINGASSKIEAFSFICASNVIFTLI